MEIERAFQDFLRSRRAGNRSPRTLAWYNVQIGMWLRWVVNQNGGEWVTPESLEEYIAQRRDGGLSDRSIDGFWRALKAFLNWVRKRRPMLLNGNQPPTDIVERPTLGQKRPRVAGYESVCKLLRSIGSANWFDYRDRAIVQLMLSAGLRVEEIVHLRTYHIEVSDRFIIVEAGKGNKERVVPYDIDFSLAFTGWIYNRPVGFDDWLFIGADRAMRPNGPMTTNAVRKMLIRRCAEIGLPYINPHSVRHLFATKALNDGVQLSAVSAMLGHTSPSFTARVYAKWLKRGLRKEYDQNWQTR